MSSSFPPPGDARNTRKPLWLRGWFWAAAIIVLILIAVILGNVASDESATEGAPEVTTSASSPATTAPSPSSARKTVGVPSVLFKTVRTARARLRAKGFEVKLTPTLTNGYVPGTIVESEGEGLLMRIGATVQIWVARPVLKIPNVVGKTLADAKRALDRAGFDSTARSEYLKWKITWQSSSQPERTVISQSPAGGTPVHAGQAVSLVVTGTGPEPSPFCAPGYPQCLTAATITVDDSKDVDATLDVRSVSAYSIAGGEKVRFTVEFWNVVPAWLLRRHPIEIDMGVARKAPAYMHAIFRNAKGHLRIVWGEAGSNCCFRKPARRVDRFTFTAKLPFNIFGAAPPPTWMHGYSSRKIDCTRPRCYLGGRILDRTSWVPIQ